MNTANHKLRFVVATAFFLTLFSSIAHAEVNSAQPAKTEQPSAINVLFETTVGNFTVELNAEKAPITVANFLQYVDDGFYDSTIFHRVINGFMVQGGGFTSDLSQKKTRDPITNEADNGLINAIGTIAMARTAAPHSATAQFYINVEDNEFLNHKNKNPAGWGYAVFGKVTEGMKTIDAIKQVATHRQGLHANVPIKPIIIERASRVSE